MYGPRANSLFLAFFKRPRVFTLPWVRGEILCLILVIGTCVFRGICQILEEEMPRISRCSCKERGKQNLKGPGSLIPSNSISNKRKQALVCACLNTDKKTGFILLLSQQRQENRLYSALLSTTTRKQALFCSCLNDDKNTGIVLVLSQQQYEHVH